MIYVDKITKNVSEQPEERYELIPADDQRITHWQKLDPQNRYHQTKRKLPEVRNENKRHKTYNNHILSTSSFVESEVFKCTFTWIKPTRVVYSKGKSLGPLDYASLW